MKKLLITIIFLISASIANAGMVNSSGHVAGDLRVTGSVTIGSTQRVDTLAKLTAAQTDSTVSQVILNAAVTLTANLELLKPTHIEYGGKITTGTYTLTVSDAFLAGRYEVFDVSGGGTIDFNGNVDTGFPEWFGAVGDGSTDDSTAIDTLIDIFSAEGYGVVSLAPKEYVCNITAKPYVTISGNSPVLSPYTDTSTTSLKAAGTGAVIDTPATESKGITIQNIAFRGLGSGTACVGVKLRNVARVFVEDCSFDNFADEAILQDAGGTTHIERVFAQNCLLDRSRAAKSGVLTLAGNDSFVLNSEFTASSSSLSDSNAYVCAILISGSNNVITNAIGEISDVGIHISGDNNRFVGCRADLNFGNGYELTATAANNQMVGCLALRNGQETDNTYDGFYVADENYNIFSGCVSSGLSSDSNKPRYGFYDLSNSNTTQNFYYGCTGNFNSTGLFFAEAYLGAHWSFPTEGIYLFTASDATPSVSAGKTFRTQNSGSTTITDFDDGLPGQTIYIVAGDANTTIDDGANIKTNTDADKTLTADRVYSFTQWNGTWFEAE